MNGPGVNVNWVPGMTLDEMEKNVILAALRFYRGNKTQTAGALKISIRTLDNKIERYEADAREEQVAADKRRAQESATLERLRGKELTRQFGIGSSNQWAREPALDGTRNEEAGEESREITPRPSSGPAARVPVEPAVAAKSESGVPVSERSQVQKVLPRQAAANSSRRGR